MSENSQNENAPQEKAAVTLPAVVDKIIPSADPRKPDKAQIVVEAGDDLYREIRVDNTLHDADGNPVALKKGAEIELTIEADPKDVIPGKPAATRSHRPSVDAKKPN